MDSAGPLAGIVILFVLFIFEFIFYGLGSAIQNINYKDIQKKAIEKNDKKSIRLSRIMSDPFRYINTVQLVTTAITLSMGAFYFKSCYHIFDQSIPYPVLSNIITFFIILFLLLTFGVYIPKRLGKKYALSWAYGCVQFAYYIMILLFPITWLVTATGNLILRVFGIKEKENESDVTEDEILSMVNEGHEQGVLKESEAKMITNIFAFCDKEAQDIMTNRQNIIGLSSDMTLKDAISIMLEGNNSRYPVYQENLDHIIGMIHLKDALRHQHNGDEELKKISDINDLIRSVEFVPETKNINDIFKKMQTEKMQMVIVIDEYGQTTGLIAMEDILEEIVGNIEDEYDEEEEYIEEKGQDEYIIEGMTPLDELEEKFDISFDEDEFETLNGYLISKMDKIPDDNEDFDIDVGDYNFKIIKVEDRMIQEVLVTKKKKEVE